MGRLAGEVETSLDVGRNPVSDIEIAAYGIPIAMVAIAVDPLRRNSGKIIERPGNAAGAGLSLHIAEAANVDQAVERARIATGRRDEIDCADRKSTRLHSRN